MSHAGPPHGAGLCRETRVRARPHSSAPPGLPQGPLPRVSPGLPHMPPHAASPPGGQERTSTMIQDLAVGFYEPGRIGTIPTSLCFRPGVAEKQQGLDRH